MDRKFVYALLGKEYSWATPDYIMHNMGRMKISMYLEELIAIKLMESGGESDENHGAEVVEVNTGHDLRMAMGM